MSTALLIPPHRRTKAHGGASRSHLELPQVVSATSLSARAEVRAMVRPDLPNYALRRLVVGSLAAVALIVGVLGLVDISAGFTGTPASAASASPAAVDAAPSVHVAHAGDTLWSIANTYRGNVNRDRFINALVRLNGGVEIQAGQAVWLP
jgi:nucleoid-associated protein YgaU